MDQLRAMQVFTRAVETNIFNKAARACIDWLAQLFSGSPLLV
jgi:hypothetical protein